MVTAGFLGTTGVLHFAKPEHYDAIVPRALPGSARFYTYASGAAELGIAGLLTHAANPTPSAHSPGTPPYTVQ